ncbi:GMC family oxidoreductase [Sesbania bispinosa]|nr:GMC family oxidoreductase [Sesbania bispinosa]
MSNPNQRILSQIHHSSFNYQFNGQSSPTIIIINKEKEKGGVGACKSNTKDESEVGGFTHLEGRTKKRKWWKGRWIQALEEEDFFNQALSLTLLQSFLRTLNSLSLELLEERGKEMEPNETGSGVWYKTRKCAL